MTARIRHLREALTTLRQELRWIATVLLCGHVAVFAATTVLLHSTRSVAADQRCTCIHGVNAQCPMHRRTEHGPRCRSNTRDRSTATVIAMLGHAGVLTNTPCVVAPKTFSESMTRDALAISTCTISLDGPPPRA